MAVQLGLCQTWSKNPKDRFSHDVAYMLVSSSSSKTMKSDQEPDTEKSSKHDETANLGNTCTFFYVDNCPYFYRNFLKFLDTQFLLYIL